MPRAKVETKQARHVMLPYTTQCTGVRRRRNAGSYHGLAPPGTLVSASLMDDTTRHSSRWQVDHNTQYLTQRRLLRHLTR